MERAGRGEKAWLLMTIAMMLFTLVCFGYYAVARFGSIGTAIKYTNGKVISANTDRIVISHAKPNEFKTIEFSLKNHGNERISIIGCGMGCFAVPIDNMPFDIQPREDHVFKINALIPKKPGVFESKINIYTNLDRQKMITLSLKILID